MATTIFQLIALFSIIQVAQKTFLKTYSNIGCIWMTRARGHRQLDIHKKNWKFITDLIRNKFPISIGLMLVPTLLTQQNQQYRNKTNYFSKTTTAVT